MSYRNKNLGYGATAALAGMALKDAYSGAKNYGKAAYKQYRKRKWSRTSGVTKKGRTQARNAPYNPTYVGMPIGASATKSATNVNTVNRSTATRTLYSHDISWLAKTTTNQIDERQRDLINCIGFKLHFSTRLVNERASPVICHFAVISPRGASSSWTTGVNDCVGTDEFFRFYEARRSTDFSNSLTGQEFNLLPINSDHYTILKHDKIKLMPPRHVYNSQGGVQVFAESNPNTVVTREYYLPLGRQLRYDDNTEICDLGRCAVVIWYEFQHGQPTGSIPTDPVGEYDLHNVMIFREPRN